MARRQVRRPPPAAGAQRNDVGAVAAAAVGAATRCTRRCRNAEASLSQLMKREMMQNTGRIGISADQVNMSAEHEDAVDLVGMLFDVLFDERDFEAQARTLISRLVVPYVKAAVMDRRLFQYKTHPARRLLNSLSEAVEGNKGEGPQEKELLHKAEETVDRLVADFNEDIAIFETLEQELRSFLEQHNRRIELAERRATESQRGQERLEQARTLAAAELSRRIEDRALPAPLNDFLSRSWSHHLSMIALREGAGQRRLECRARRGRQPARPAAASDGVPAPNVNSSRAEPARADRNRAGQFRHHRRIRRRDHPRPRRLHRVGQVGPAVGPGGKAQGRSDRGGRAEACPGDRLGQGAAGLQRGRHRRAAASSRSAPGSTWPARTRSCIRPNCPGSARFRRD